MWKFYRIKFFSSQRPRRAGALALSQSEAGAQSGLRGNVAAAAKHFTFSKDILRGGQGGLEYSIVNTAILRK